MTYPPQQPGPYGQGPYGQPPPDPYGHQSSYQGLGGYPGSGGPGGMPPRKRTGAIIAVVVVAVLVVGGAGTGIFFLTKGDDKPTNTAADQTTSSNPKASGRSTDDSQPSDDPTPTGEGGGSNPDAAGGPAEVQQAYIRAYESKNFDSVVNSACDAYKEKFGTDTSKLEGQLAPFDITATADGEPEVSGTSAFAMIDLELSKGGDTQSTKIKIKIVEEGGTWKFCGEDEA